VTNNHVVRACGGISIVTQGDRIRGTVAASDRADDLALIALPETLGTSARLRLSRPPQLGEKIFVAGYPLRGFLADDLIVTSGEVNALAGPYNDRRFLQISAPVQNGSSGAPVLDAAGNVIGIVSSSLNSMDLARQTGDIPQNVNFAVKGAVVRSFLDIHGIVYGSGSLASSLASEAVASKARDFAVLVECYR
jgi:S1-C subfamily serine protease